MLPCKIDFGRHALQVVSLEVGQGRVLGVIQTAFRQNAVREHHGIKVIANAMVPATALRRQLLEESICGPVGTEN